MFSNEITTDCEIGWNKMFKNFTQTVVIFLENLIELLTFQQIVL